MDRGGHQLEVICLLFALKVALPTQVWLIRGNHEDGQQNKHMQERGFHRECMSRLGATHGAVVFAAFEEAFQWLPLGCLMDKSILVLHGGIGDGRWDAQLLRDIPRPLSHNTLLEDEVLYSVLWSDPVPDADEYSFGVHDAPRDHHSAIVKRFSQEITEDFCARNGLDMIVRSHQAKSRGFGYDVLHRGQCVRVFSARDYEGHGNDGGILSVCRWGAGEGSVVVIRPQVLRALTHSKEERR